MRIVVSDIHLGSEMCRAKRFLKFLDCTSREHHLIIAGDLIENYNLKNLKRSHWEVLQRIRDWPNKTLIAGNHEESAEKATLTFGMPFVDYYVSDNVLVCHGHHWDDFLGKFPVLESVCDFLYNNLQKFNQDFAKKLKHRLKNHIKCIEKVSSGAKGTGYRVICGHTHYPIANGSYFNTGCWTEEPGTFAIWEKNAISLHSFAGRKFPKCEC